MARYSDIVTDERLPGVPLAAVSITVIASNGNLASLTADDGTVINQPFLTGAFGAYAFNIPNPGDQVEIQYRYKGRLLAKDDIIVGQPNIFKGDPGGNVMSVGAFASLASLNILPGTDRVVASNGAAYIADPAMTAAYVAANPRTAVFTANGRGFRLDPLQRLQIEFFGGVADSVIQNTIQLVYQGTDNADAIDAAINFASAYIFDTEWPFNPTIYFGTGVYYTSRTIQPRGAMHIVGEQASVATGTVIRFPPNTIGVLLNNRNCIRDGGGYTSTPQTSSSGSIIENIFFQGGGQIGDTTKHGFWGRTDARLIGNVFANFPGKGEAWIGYGNHTDSTYGAPNEWYSERNTVLDCGDISFYVEGSDANDGISIHDRVKDGLSAAFVDLSGLGNTYIKPTINGCGQVAGIGQSQGRVWYNGYQWRLITLTSTGDVPTSGVSKWLQIGPQAAASPYWPAWSANTTYRFDGAFYAGGASNQTVITGYYVESLLIALQDSQAMAVGGNAFPTLGSNNLMVSQGQLVATNGIGGLQRWKALGLPQQSYLGDFSYANVGLPGSHLQHYDALEDRTFDYHADGNGDHVYANGTLGTGETAIWTLFGRYTKRTAGRKATLPYAMMFGSLVVTDPDNPLAGSRSVRYASGPPSGTDFAYGELCVNNGLVSGNNAVDYWIWKGSAWQARP